MVCSVYTHTWNLSSKCVLQDFVIICGWNILWVMIESMAYHMCVITSYVGFPEGYSLCFGSRRDPVKCTGVSGNPCQEDVSATPADHLNARNI